RLAGRLLLHGGSARRRSVRHRAHRTGLARAPLGSSGQPRIHAMSRRFRLAPAFLIIALGVALALHMSPSRAGSPVDAATARAVGGVAITVEDMDRSVDFYSTALFVEKVSDVQAAGPEIERRLRVPGARGGAVALRLGGWGHVAGGDPGVE